MTSPTRPLVRLGDVLTKCGEWVAISPDQQYRQITVRLWGKGVTLRDKVPGAEIAAERRQVARAGQFIVSRIDARNGAFGLIPPELDGAVVSTDFPMFALDTTRLLPAYLAYLSRTSNFVGHSRRASEGTTNRVRLKENRFLAAEIRLPPLDEQRRVVQRIDNIEAKIDEARALQHQVRKSTAALWLGVLDSTFNNLYSAGYQRASVGEYEVLVTSGPRNFSSHYSSDGARFYRAQDLTTDSDISDASATYVEVPPGSNDRAFVAEGDVLAVITGATIGRVALVSPNHPRGLVSQHVGVIRVDASKVNPRYLYYSMLAPAWGGGRLTQSKYGQGKPGLNLSNLRKLEFPLPPLEEQRRLVERLDNARILIRRLQAEQGEAAAELDALPSSIVNQAFDQLQWPVHLGQTAD